MTNTTPQKVICIVDEIDATAIEKGYYPDLVNTPNQQFMSITEAENFSNKYGVTPAVGDVYAYDVSSQEYLILDPSIEKSFSLNRIEAYITTLGYMGATSVKGRIYEVEENKLTKSSDGTLEVKLIKANRTKKEQEIKELKRSLEIQRQFGTKVIKEYKEIKEYIESRGLQKDTILKNRLEELKNSPNGQLNGSYTIKTELTQTLTEIFEIGYNLTASYYFSANTNVKKTCSSFHKINYELEISFD